MAAAAAAAPPRLARHSAAGWNCFSEAAQVVLARWDLTRTAVVERVRAYIYRARARLPRARRA